MVANPRATKDFARALMQRPPTDLTMTALRVPFVEREDMRTPKNSVSAAPITLSPLRALH